MSIQLLKSILAFVMFAMAFGQIFMMFELFGRNKVRYDAATIKRIHRINGRIFILLYLFIAYFCLRYITLNKEEPSARITFHGVFALSVIILLLIKISFLRFYPKFFDKILTLGPSIAFLAFIMIAISGGYYFFVAVF